MLPLPPETTALGTHRRHCYLSHCRCCYHFPLRHPHRDLASWTSFARNCRQEEGPLRGILRARGRNFRPCRLVHLAAFVRTYTMLFHRFPRRERSVHGRTQCFELLLYLTYSTAQLNGMRLTLLLLLWSRNTQSCMQDFTMVHLSPKQRGSQNLGYDLAVFAVADGHNGSAAAEHCQELLYTLLLQHLPSKPLPNADSTGAAKPRCHHCICLPANHTVILQMYVALMHPQHLAIHCQIVLNESFGCATSRLLHPSIPLQS